MGSEHLTLEDQLFDLRRKNIDPADDHHVVRSASDFLHPAHGSRCAGQQTGQVARPIANDRQRFLGQRGQHQFTRLAVGHNRAAHRIDDFREKVVLPDRRSILGLDAFAGNTRTHHFRQTIDVDRVDSHAGFDFTPHFIRPGLCAENAQAQTRLRRVHPLSLELIGDCQHVARRHHDDVGSEIIDQLHLPLGLSAAEWHDRQAQTLGAIVSAQSTCKQSIAIAHMHQIATARTCCANRARHEIRPVVDIACGVAHYRWFAGGSA